MTKPFLVAYDGQPLRTLIAMKATHRIDSLVLAVEQALYAKPASEWSEADRVVLAVEAMEREVNNGGFEQFFLNSPPSLITILVPALHKIGCPSFAALAAEAVSAWEAPAGSADGAAGSGNIELSQTAKDKLAACTQRYFAVNEVIDQRLFDFIEAHQDAIAFQKSA